MSTKDDANVLHAWAVSQGLFPTSVLAPAVPDGEIVHAMPEVSEVGRAILRAKGIHQIVINEAQHRIYVLTKRAKPSKKQLALLPTEVGDSTVEYVTLQMGRRFVGAELKASYYQQAARNLAMAMRGTADLFAT